MKLVLPSASPPTFTHRYPPGRMKSRSSFHCRRYPRTRIVGSGLQCNPLHGRRQWMWMTTMKSRKAPRPPYWDAGPCVCRLCGDRVTRRGRSARWHLECLEEYRPVASPNDARSVAHEVSGGRCAHCGAQHDLGAATWEADHREPVWRSGGDIRFWLRSNLQVLCREPCHATKTAKDAEEYRAHQGVRSKTPPRPR